MDSSLYTPPDHYANAHAGADEATDIRYLHSSGAVIRVGGVPLVAVENLNINMSSPRNPINVIGTIVAIGFDPQAVSVQVSGQLVQLAKMSLAKSAFYPESEEDVILNVNRVFAIDILMQDYTKDDSDILTQPFLTVKNCQNTGSNIVLSPNTTIKDSFTAVGTFMKRDWDKLDQYAIAA